MTTSPVLGLPLIEGQQALPEVTHNEAVLLLQILTAGVEGLGNAPPGAPAEGEAWIIGPAPSGEWTGHPNALTNWWAGEWRFLPGYDDVGTPIVMGADQEGLHAWRKDLDQLWIWTGAAWAEYTATPTGGPYVSKVDAAVQTMAGPLGLPAGASAAPALNFSGSGGLYGESATFLAATVGFGAMTTVRGTRYDSNAANGPNFDGRRARGTEAVPVVCNSNDVTVQYRGMYWDGVSLFRTAGSQRVIVKAATPSPTDGEGRHAFFACPAGSVTQAELFGMDHATGLSMMGIGNVIIDADRLHVHRSYTVLAAPAASSKTGRSILVTNPTVGNARLYTSNGTNWYDGAGTLLA